MPPNTDATGVLFEGDAATPDLALSPEPLKVNGTDNRKLQLVWRNIILFAILHVSAIYGAYLFFFSAKWQTNLLCTLASRFHCFFFVLQLIDLCFRYRHVCDVGFGNNGGGA
jgi:hypothetical protein